MSNSGASVIAIPSCGHGNGRHDCCALIITKLMQLRFGGAVLMSGERQVLTQTCRLGRGRALRSTEKLGVKFVSEVKGERVRKGWNERNVPIENRQFLACSSAKLPISVAYPSANL